jgi:hypothetical protein
MGIIIVIIINKFTGVHFEIEIIIFPQEHIPLPQSQVSPLPQSSSVSQSTYSPIKQSGLSEQNVPPPQLWVQHSSKVQGPQVLLLILHTSNSSQSSSLQQSEAKTHSPMSQSQLTSVSKITYLASHYYFHLKRAESHSDSTS